MPDAAKVLLVEGQRFKATDLQRSLATAGYEVGVAPSGAFALTMLERDRPDLIVTAAVTTDINGDELYEIVESDPMTRGIPCVVLHEVPPLSSLIEQIGRLLQREPSVKAPAPVPAPVRTFHGSLGVMELPEITQAIAIGGKTGRLDLTLPSGQGAVVFDLGRVVHAEFDGDVGERAFARLVATAHAWGGAFCFNPTDRGGASDAPRTIQRNVEQLLLGAAAAIDEGRPADSARAEPRA